MAKTNHSPGAEEAVEAILHYVRGEARPDAADVLALLTRTGWSLTQCRCGGTGHAVYVDGPCGECQPAPLAADPVSDGENGEDRTDAR